MTVAVPGRRARLLALLTAPAPVVVALLVAAAGTPGYDHGAETISALAAPGRAMAGLARAAIALYGLVVVLAAPELAGRAPARPTVVRAAVWLYGACAVVAGLVPKVLPGNPPTTASHIHVFVALAGGASLLVAMYVVAAGGPDRTERLVAGIATVVVAVASVVFQRTWGTSVYGTAERVVLGTGVAWLSYAAWCALADQAAHRAEEVTPRA